MNNVVIRRYQDYNERRYSKPWLAIMENGKFKFSSDIGCYSANHGSAGDLVVFEPKENVIYAYGQKDYRGNNTERYYAIWNGDKFLDTDKLGKLLDPTDATPNIDEEVKKKSKGLHL